MATDCHEGHGAARLLLVTVLVVVAGVPGTRVLNAPTAPPIRPPAQALDRAYRVAAASVRWDALLEVGDAARRAGELAGSPDTADARAREPIPSRRPVRRSRSMR